jgi:hypothetical protein
MDIDIFGGRIQETGGRIQEKETWGGENGYCLLYSVSCILLTDLERKNTGDRRQNTGEGNMGRRKRLLSPVFRLQYSPH